jgi:hypothetical protein
MLPRQVLPRQFYLVTRRCTQRRFLLRPDTATNSAFLYCLTTAALRSEIDILLPCARGPYQSAEGASTHPLNDAQAALDAAYVMPPDQCPTELLLELNQLVAEDEEQGRKVRGPGVPDHLDPEDSRWFSADCIEPPVGS